MKKLLFVLLVMLCLVGLTACTDLQTPDQGEPNQDNNAIDAADDFANLASGSYAQMIKNQHYYIEYTLYTGSSNTITVKEAKDGANVDTMGIAMSYPYRSILLDNTLYNFSEPDKTYTTHPISSDQEMTVEDSIDYSGMVFVTSGNDAIPGFDAAEGQSYDYDQYQMTAQTATEEVAVEMRFYLKGGELYVIYTNIGDNEEIWVVDVLTDEIPAGMLEIPAGYSNIGAI